jgi:hypothetical protein
MTSETQQTRRPCSVCDAQSIGINFSVPTCMACKAFFRRNAVKLGVTLFFSSNIQKYFNTVFSRIMNSFV